MEVLDSVVIYIHLHPSFGRQAKSELLALYNINGEVSVWFFDEVEAAI